MSLIVYPLRFLLSIQPDPYRQNLLSIGLHRVALCFASASWSSATLGPPRTWIVASGKYRISHTACVTDNSAEAVLLPDAE